MYLLSPFQSAGQGPATLPKSDQRVPADSSSGRRQGLRQRGAEDAGGILPGGEPPRFEVVHERRVEDGGRNHPQKVADGIMRVVSRNEEVNSNGDRGKEEEKYEEPSHPAPKGRETLNSGPRLLKGCLHGSVRRFRQVKFDLLRGSRS